MSQRKISVFQGAGLLLSTLLGSGVLIIPALAATQSGANSLYAWVIMAFAVLPIVFTFAALGRTFPNEGGTAYFVKQAFGETLSKAIGWLYVAIAPIGPPVVFITGAAYFAQLIGVHNPLTLELLMLAVVLVLSLAKLETSVKFQTYLSIAITLIIIVVCAAGLFGPSVPKETAPLTFISLGKSLVIIFWCFVGIEAICHVANDFHKPKTEFPKAVVLGVFMAVMVYVMVSLSVIKQGTYGSESENLLSVVNVAKQSIGGWAYKLIAAVGFAGCLAAVNLYVISFSRMFYSMANQGTVSKVFAKKNKHNSPYVSVLLVCGSIALVLIGRHLFSYNLEYLLTYANAVFVFIYLAACTAGIKLLTGYAKIIAVISTLFCLTVCAFLMGSAGYGVAVFFAAVIFYGYKKRPLKESY